ncbi:hypothetical protein BN946_scf185014.g39 [Trametes cinnabarina]|uniref:Hemerythrin-like domain-containing protein n=1 Tax=Pycnoporus cinnabarinus TaxID=5643 RepID=A0A060SMV1_PYCCI|nr:hypothetical protein BN946_scf185014.g39 [Trametes cinnabarina]
MYASSARTALASFARTRTPALFLRPTAARFALRTMATGGTYLDVTHEIKLDHDNVRDLFERYKAATDLNQKTIIANTLIREMAIHGDAEEISVYNDYSALGLADTAAHNKEEHAEIKKLVYDADATRVTKAEYDDVLQRAVTAFLTHAKEEEDEQHPLIRQKLSPEDNDKIARAFLKARTTVPTRPHPWAPQTGGIAQKAAGLQGALHDKVVETVEGRQFVDLKYQHPSEF